MDLQAILDDAAAVAEHNKQDLVRILTAIGPDHFVKCIRPAIGIIKEMQAGKDSIVVLETSGPDFIQIAYTIGWDKMADILPNFIAIGRTLVERQKGTK